MAAIPNSSDILQAVIEATPDAIFVKDLDGRYVLINEAAARFLGKPPADIVGKHDLELYPEATARRFIEADRQVLASGTPQSFEGTATTSLGTQDYLVTKGVYRDRDGRILGVYGISHDITELKHAQESLEHARAALVRSQKLEAVGQLTGGIAHDFNNILMVILGNIDLLKRGTKLETAAAELVGEVQHAAEHGQQLVNDLLTFAGRRHLHPQPIDVNALVERMARLLDRTLGSGVRVALALGADAGAALADPTALEAAVLNVSLNARDAMTGGGTLTIRTSRAAMSGAGAAEADLKPGTYAVLSLEDTGEGMAPDVVARLFEPFFTTKAKGTGLGLSMVYGFARQSGGAVTAESTPGHGTTIRIYLPVAS